MGLAHDVVTLQSTLRIHADLASSTVSQLTARSDANPLLAQTVRAQMDALLRSLDLMTSMLGGLVDPCRSGRGSSGGAGSFWLHELLGGLQQMLRPAGLGAGSSLSVKALTHCLLRGDARVIQRLLLNLVHNAIRHSEASHIAVTGAWIESEGLELRVENTVRRGSERGPSGFGVGLLAALCGRLAPRRPLLGEDFLLGLEPVLHSVAGLTVASRLVSREGAPSDFLTQASLVGSDLPSHLAV